MNVSDFLSPQVSIKLSFRCAKTFLLRMAHNDSTEMIYASQKTWTVWQFELQGGFPNGKHLEWGVENESTSFSSLLFMCLFIRTFIQLLIYPTSIY